MASVRNAADEDQIKEAKKKAGLERRQELSDLREVLALAGGRRLIWRYLSMCGVYRLSYALNAGIYFAEGQRDIGLKLMADIMEANDEALILMMREAKSKEAIEGADHG